MGKKLGPAPQRWLKSFHLLFVALWVGGAVTLSTRQFFVTAPTGEELYGILSMMNYVDFFIIIPGAVGCLLTGFIYSTWTRWGWFRHRWITVKWIICLYGVIFGTYPLGPWLGDIVQLARLRGLDALSDPRYMHNMRMLWIFGTFQAATLIAAVFISSVKPWRREGQSGS